MKFLKTILMIIGVVGVIVACVLLGNSYINLVSLTNVANANNSKSPFVNPFQQIAMEVGIGALGGLLLGLGIGLPGRTAGAIRNQALDDAAAQRQASIANRAVDPGDVK